MVKFDFTKRDIVMMAAFLALLLITAFVFLAGQIIGTIFYGIFWGIILITAAIVIGKKYTILVLGLIYTLIAFPMAHSYGGTLVAINTVVGALILEAFLLTASPYASKLKVDILGIILFALVSRTVFVTILIFVYGMVLPLWTVMALILPHLITYPIGGAIGFKMGNKVKNVLESV